MKLNFTKKICSLGIVAGLLTTSIFAQAQLKLADASIISFSKNTQLPNFIKLSPNQTLHQEDFVNWANHALALPQGAILKAYDITKDNLGYTHTRYKQFINNIPVEGSMLITHSKDGRIVSLNGDFFPNINTDQSPSVAESTALKSALNKVNAQKYKWENQAETKAMRESTGQADFTYYPKGELVIVHKRGADFSASNFRLAYKFNIYAEKPLSRAYVFVDANTAEVISEEQIIHTADVVGTANTKFSGTQTMTSDNYGTATQYRLRETGRGNGIQTYNCNTSTNYTNTDFTNTSATWNITGTNQAATDAHWGAEVTYDYYNIVHARNSIDDAGLALLSYVHYDVNYDNAFWDGQRMTYGDGNVGNGFLIMTALDVCGHEITHGLTQYTAGLNGGGNGEEDALNESFSDIFGTTIETYARPAQHDWLIGADITCNGAGVQDHQGIRNMANPNAFAQPDTYQGTYWDNSGEPHTNDGPSNYWYYLLSQGGSGSNDNGNAYSITGISMNEARMIAYRGLAFYFTPSTVYADARTYTIQAANDLYGGCSPEVIATTNAWYAVGVGPAFSASVTANFAANATSSCTLPFNVTFNNTSVNGSTAVWDFGDGSSSTAFNPTHAYTTAGTYNVKLIVSGACGTDSVIQSSYIIVNPPPAPTAAPGYSCTSPASVTLTASGSGTLNWYANPTGGAILYTGTNYTTPPLSSNTTYYVSSLVPGATGNVGPTTTSFGTGGMHNNTSVQYLTFDVLQPCTLQTVLVNSGAAGSRNVLLWDNTGGLLQTIPVTFANGISTATLNIHLIPGSYRIGGTSMNLWRNNSGPSYPYTLSGVINITGSSAGTGYYYYFYNWQVQNDACLSPRTAVAVSIGSPSVSYTSAYDTLCVSASAVSLSGGLPAGGSYSGIGVSTGMFDPAIAGAGMQTITYSYSDSNGCTSTATHDIYVDPCAVTTGIATADAVSGLALYPNPTTGLITLELGAIKDETAELRVVNALGQVITNRSIALTTGNNKFTFNLNDHASGMYMVQLKTPTSLIVKRITKN